jgi:ATP-binding cassette subfamily B protein
MSMPTRFGAFIFHFVKKQWLGFLSILVTSIVWSLNESFFPYFIKLLVDGVGQLDPHKDDAFIYLAPILMSLTGIWFAMEVALRLQGYIMRATFPYFRANIREEVFNYVRGHSHDYFTANLGGTIANKISELPKSCEQIMETLIFNMFPILAAFIISIGLIGQVSILFSFILLGWFILHIGTTLVFLKKIMKTSEDHSEAVSGVTGQIVDCLSNIMNVRLFARGTYERHYLNHYQNDEIQKSKRAVGIVQIVKLIQGFLSFLLMMFVIYTLIYGWSKGWVTLGDFSLIIMTAFSMMGLIWFVDSQLSLVFREMGVVKASLSLISEVHTVKDIESAQPLKVTKGEIRFDKVTFNYKRNSNLFNDESLTIKAGQKVGLVGFSGSGKTTFANLILRFYDVADGRILIDNQDIACVTQDSLHEQIAMIPQDPALFHRTLMENIRYGRLDAKDEEVIEAAKRAHCHEFIEHLDQGYQTLVGERGGKLSGGQRQRIAVARAILKNAPILILDEATSALDSMTEKLIQESLKDLMQNCTTLVIAHRLSTLAEMDRILVFDKGHVIEDGSVKELFEKKGYFARMWQMQNHGFLPGEENT